MSAGLPPLQHFFPGVFSSSKLIELLTENGNFSASCLVGYSHDDLVQMYKAHVQPKPRLEANDFSSESQSVIEFWVKPEPNKTGRPSGASLSSPSKGRPVDISSPSCTKHPNGDRLKVSSPKRLKNNNGKKRPNSESPCHEKSKKFKPSPIGWP